MHSPYPATHATLFALCHNRCMPCHTPVSKPTPLHPLPALSEFCDNVVLHTCAYSPVFAAVFGWLHHAPFTGLSLQVGPEAVIPSATVEDLWQPVLQCVQQPAGLPRISVRSFLGPSPGAADDFWVEGPFKPLQGRDPCGAVQQGVQPVRA